MTDTVLVTGGAGFIGSTLVRHLLSTTQARVVNIDKLTYAGDLESLKPIENHNRYHFEQVDITDYERVSSLFMQYRPTRVMHLAAESHVDRSISGPKAFIDTNITGTFNLLEAARHYWADLSDIDRGRFRFLHVSTDEVYGYLGSNGFFTEQSPYQPSSPYSASKAASDHLVRAWHHTYGMPTLVTNCSNNYGPYQFPEKLIPVIVTNALQGRPIPIYGKGENVRDWLYVEDHVRALLSVIDNGTLGETYLIGGHGERTNLEVAQTICRILDELAPNSSIGSYTSLITFVTDRLGHDFRYAIDPSKIERDIKWKAQESFESGFRKTIKWYLENQDWCARLLKRLKEGK